jgi:hypothetical protein
VTTSLTYSSKGINHDSYRICISTIRDHARGAIGPGGLGHRRRGGGQALDRQLKELQREANDLSQELAKWGFTLLPPILTDLAVLDFIQLRNDFRHAVNVMKDPAKRRAELAQLLAGMVKEELQDVKTRQAFVDSVSQQAAALGVFPSPAKTSETAKAA